MLEKDGQYTIIQKADTPVEYRTKTLKLLAKYETNMNTSSSALSSRKSGLLAYVKGLGGVVFYVANKMKESAVNLWHGKEPLKNITILGMTGAGIIATALLFPVLKFGLAGATIAMAIHDATIGVAYMVTKLTDASFSLASKTKTQGSFSGFKGVTQDKRFELTPLECERLELKTDPTIKQAFTFIKTLANLKIQTLQIQIEENKLKPITDYIGKRSNPKHKRYFLSALDMLGINKLTKWTLNRYSDYSQPVENKVITRNTTAIKKYRLILKNIKKGYLSAAVESIKTLPESEVGLETAEYEKFIANITDKKKQPKKAFTSKTQQILNCLRQIPGYRSRIKVAEYKVEDTNSLFNTIESNTASVKNEISDQESPTPPSPHTSYKK